MYVRCFLHAVTLAVLLLTTIHAQAQDKQLKSGVDPTDFVTRFEPEFRYVEFEEGGEVTFGVLRGDLLLTEDYITRLDVPFGTFDPSPAQRGRGISGKSGIGDIAFQVLRNFKTTETIQDALGIGFRFDTASEDGLGQGGASIAALYAASHGIQQDWLFLPEVKWEYGSSLDNPLTGISADRNLLSFKPNVAWEPFLPSITWLLIETELAFEFEESDTLFNIGAEYGLMFLPDIAFFGGVSLGAADSEKDWSFQAGLRALFPEQLPLFSQ